MKKHLFAAAIAVALASGASAADNNDPVLMTVDGHDIRVSEFEYLYNKNNSQQQQPQSLDEYLQMFIDYKLKVADAEHAGLEKSPEFINEFSNFRAELATPYLRLQEVEDRLVEEAYSHRKNDVYASHIMMPNDDKSMKTIDSLRAEILKGSITFEDAARRYSVDRNSSARGGLMGYVVPDRYPWPFEKVAYETEIGKISPVVNSGYGLHLIRVESVTPAAGQVLASHILLQTRGKSEPEIQAQKALADSLYNVVKGGADFADVATRYSEDPGSARNGGSLDWFGRGAMVAQFDSVSFALRDGEVSAPFSTAFGYHIVKRFDHKDIAPLEELRPAIVAAMARDGRSKAPAEEFLKSRMKAENAVLDMPAFDRVRKIIEDKGGYDSTVIVSLKAMDMPLASFNGGRITLSEVVAQLPLITDPSPEYARDMIEIKATEMLENAVLDKAREELARTNSDYRNLVNEYRDGILLYEISNRNVWEKAAKDTEGLNAFFKKNIANYKWDTPKFKSYIFFATSDSVLNDALQYAETLSTAEPAEFTKQMRERYGRDIKVERVIAAKGENAITDYLAFDGPKPTSEVPSKWKAYGAYKGRVIDMPEEAADVRGAAVTDYQSLLDKEWVKKLRKKYKVKVNKKVFKNLKEHQND